MRIAVLVKQVPVPEEMELGPDGRLRRDGVDLEMNSYCRRAVSIGVTLAKEAGGRCSVFTLGPPSAEDVLREAVAWGADDGVLVTDPAFGGSDTLATARALAAALEREGPFDLVVAGRNSIDADTGQVGPQVAELLDLPFVGGIRQLSVDAGEAHATSELDDGSRDVVVALPAVFTTAERLCEPAKVPPDGRAAVPGDRLRRLTAADLGPGPWGVGASRTVVGPVRTMEVTRRRVVLEGDVADQVARATALLAEWGGLSVPSHGDPDRAEPVDGDLDPVAPARPEGAGPDVVVVVEPDRPRTARELLGEAAILAGHLDGSVVAFDVGGTDADALASWGADRVVRARPGVEEDVAASLSAWCDDHEPWAVLVPGTQWGRQVAARASVRLDAGLVGDAVGFGVKAHRLVAWKPAFGGLLVAAITATSAVQLATVRPGVLPERAPRPVGRGAETLDAAPSQVRQRVRVLAERRDDEVEALLAARAVVAVGAGVDPDEYGLLEPLTRALRAELGASRKVTDKGWLPRARQVGITGHSVAPALYLAVGISGKFNHMVGTRSAGLVVAINQDPSAPVFDWVDLGIVGDWHEAVPLLAEAVAARPAPSVSPGPGRAVTSR